MRFFIDNNERVEFIQKEVPKKGPLTEEVKEGAIDLHFFDNGVPIGRFIIERDGPDHIRVHRASGTSLRLHFGKPIVLARETT